MTTSVTPADTVQTRSVSYVNAQLTVDLRDETVPAAPAASEALVDEAEKSTEVQTAGKSVPLAQLWRYRSRSDAIKVAIGSFAAFVQGWALPFLLVLFGEAINELAKPDPMPAIERLATYFVYCGLVAGTMGFIQRYIFINYSIKMVSQIRRAYVEALLRQDMAWHDQHPAAALEIRLVDAVPKIKTALGAKLGNVWMQGGTVIGGLVFALYYSAELTGIAIAGLIPTFIAIGGQLGVIESFQSTKTKMYEKAGVVAHEVLSLVRVVATFGTYDRESARYLKDVRMSTSKGKAWGRKAGAMLALPDATFQLIYALLFWYGGRMVRDGEIQVGDILNVFFNVLMSLFTAALGLQYLQDAQTAKVAAWGLFEVIDRESEIDGLGEGGATPGTVNGKLVVEDVRFAYPSAPTDTVLHGLSFTVEKGKTTALVGHSGCGKSTIINLLLRFYEPTSGAITLDGKPLSAYNIQWLRQRIGLVAQQPTLLPGTIRENIALGKANCTNKEIVAAAKSANAHDFIMGFPDQYETEVGALGGKLSGGQKQRIAIARIMIASPDILLLDEATSALDNVSEAKFQDLLSKTKHTRATVVIAHRLSTVEDADEIIVMDHGVVVERGTHASLLANKGKYFNMVNATAASNHPATDADADADANAAASNVSEPVGAAEVTVTGSSLRDNESLATTESKDAENDDAASDSDAAPDKAEAKAMWHFMWGFAKPEIPLVAFACLGAIIHGLSIDAGFLILGLTIEVVAGGYTHKPFQCSVTADNTLGNFTDSFDCLLSSTCKANTACWGCTHTANGSYAAVSDCSATDCTDPYGAGCSFDQVQPAEEEDLNPLILAYVVIFATLFIGKYIQNSSELVAAENMIGKLRAHSFDVFIRKSAAWQDHYRTSDMTEALAVSCADSSKLTVQRWPKIMNILAILIGAIAVAFAYCWRLAAVTIAVLPLLVASQASDMASQLGLDKDGEGTSKELKAMADKVAQDAAVIIENLRDIVALGRSRDLIDRYRDDLAKLDVVISKQTPIAGFTAFMAQIIMFCQWGLAFWYGGKQMMDGNCDFGEMNIAIICIIFSGFQAGQEMAFIPDDKAATVTMVKLHKMLTFQTKDDQRLAPGITGGITVAKGEIVFKDVEFAYPTRKSAKVLDKLNLTIEAGKTVALVGQSGCGKSTVISLIQNLYSIDGGSITIDGQDISGASGDTLRRQIAVVPQEPKLFNMSIADNIAYRPQELPVLQEQIEGSAKIANADGFIAELSDGYRYAVGKFGEKLSGGQRQRVAIARSVFSDGDVKVLLLDEATSALDNKNEKLVQLALGTATMGRTTVIVAHRLSTIKNADKICVFEAGRVVEQGTFAALMAKNGAFASYYNNSAIA